MALWLPLFAYSVTDEPVDSLMLDLDEVEVSASGNTASTRLDRGKIKFNPENILTGVHTFGEADIINKIKRMSGVTTAGDYGAGLMIDGAEPSQSIYRIAGAPVFFPYRFGGIFSTFNTSHFRTAIFERGIHDASMPARLGSKIDFETFDRVSDRCAGTVNAGILSSSATVKLPLSRRLSVIASGRISYIDELYGRLLKRRYSEVHYRFYDINLTANFNIDNNNVLSFNLFHNGDKLRYDDVNYALDTHIGWSNTLATLRWRHNGSLSMTHRVYWSGFSNALGLDMPQVQVRMPSSLSVAGVAGDMRRWCFGDRVDLKFGYEAGLYRNVVQWSEVEGFGTSRPGENSGAAHPFELRAYVDASCQLSERFDMSAGVAFYYFQNGRYRPFAADPRATLTGHFGDHTFHVHAGIYSQFLHQVGFSETGMSSDFWIVSSARVPKQRAYAADIQYVYFMSDAGIRFEGDVYFKWLTGQSEYFGQVLDLLDYNYEAEKYIMVGRGYNAGVNLTASKEFGRFCGTVGAGYGVARRHFEDFDRYMRGRTDPGLTLTLEAVCRLDKRWTLGADFRFAGGRPYTPAKEMYLVAGNLITVYGDPNSERFPPYHRLDLSATVRLGRLDPQAHTRHLLNVSLINVYGRRNVEMRKYVLDMAKGSFRLREVGSLYRFLPSISYTLEF